VQHSIKSQHNLQKNFIIDLMEVNMGEKIPEKFLDLFSQSAFGHLATTMPDGSPQVSPVWVDFDGEYIIVNSVAGRQKDLNIKRDPRVAIEVQDSQNPYRYLLVRGKVVEITTTGAEENIDQLALRYTGELYKNKNPNSPRVIYKVLPLHVRTSNS
jgi:PPOX class probable F420-dependent enzyme